MRTAKQVEINTIGRDADISTVKQLIDVEKSNIRQVHGREDN